MKIGSIKPHIISLNQFWGEEAQSLRLPTIQRQFVWDAEDIRDLLDSIINGYPIGAIIIWEPASISLALPSWARITRTPSGMSSTASRGSQPFHWL